MSFDRVTPLTNTFSAEAANAESGLPVNRLFPEGDETADDKNADEENHDHLTLEKRDTVLDKLADPDAEYTEQNIEELKERLENGVDDKNLEYRMIEVLENAAEDAFLKAHFSLVPHHRPDEEAAPRAHVPALNVPAPCLN